MTTTGRVVGVLGGMGPDATVDFMSKVVACTPAKHDHDHIRMLVNHNPQVPDRQIDTDEQRKAVRATLADMAQGLQDAGAEFLVMPCNTAHGFLDDVYERVDIPFLNIVTETVHAIRRAYPDASAVGVMATDACLNAELYQSAIRDAGMSVIVPSADVQTLLMELISRIKCGDQSSDVADEMARCANSLVQLGAQVIAGGCTEIPLVLNAENLSVPFVSSTDVLAERTVALGLNQEPLANQLRS